MFMSTKLQRRGHKIANKIQLLCLMVSDFYTSFEIFQPFQTDL